MSLEDKAYIPRKQRIRQDMKYWIPFYGALREMKIMYENYPDISIGEKEYEVSVQEGNDKLETVYALYQGTVVSLVAVGAITGLVKILE